MDVQNLRAKHHLLISYLEENNYVGVYIRRFELVIDDILEKSKKSNWKSYTDVYSTYKKLTTSNSNLRVKRNLIGAIERFDLEGIYPSRFNRNHFLKKQGYSQLCPAFKKIIDIYLKVERGNGRKKDSSIYSESHNVTAFFLFLQGKGIADITAITEKAVLDFFYQDGVFCKGYAYKRVICAVLKICAPYFPLYTFDMILTFIPDLHEERKNIQYLTEDELLKMKNVLMGSESSLCFRDKAIGMIALYTGMRSCDIAKLTMADIDWHDDLILISQQKTGDPLDLPLRALVGNAIFDYIKEERPQSTEKEIFLSQLLPIKRLTRTNMYDISVRIMSVAKIRLKPGDRKGLHLFRHHLATTLLENGVPQPVISKALGHQSPNSLDPYLNADFSHLKSCALSIDPFPVKKEVLL